jgi:hypothetical protein
MTYYAMSSITSITVGAGHGGCGRSHDRPAGADGQPLHPWALTCAACETYLATDPQWAKTIAEIVPTHDEARAREAFELQGSKDKDALLMVALARMAGLDRAQVPPTIQRMISGLAPHIPGQVVCGQGHPNAPGSRFCSQCGSQMSAPVSAASLPAGQAA